MERLFDVPTDSLYKFLALFGLAVMVTSGVVGANAYVEQAESLLKNDVAVTGLQARIQELLSRVESLRDKSEASSAKMQALVEGNRQRERHLSDEEELAFRVAAATRDRAFRDSEDATSGLPKMVEQSRSLSQEREFLVRRGTRVSVVVVASVAFGIVGCAIAALGFSLWYLRLQRYVDVEVRNRA